MIAGRLAVEASQPCFGRIDKYNPDAMAYVYSRADDGGLARAAFNLSAAPEFASKALMKEPDPYNPSWVAQTLSRHLAPARLPRMPVASTVIWYCPRASHTGEAVTPAGSARPEIVSRDLWVPGYSRVMARKNMDPHDPVLAEIDAEGTGFVPVTLGSGEVIMQPAVSLPLTPAERKALQCIDVVPLRGSFTAKNAFFALVHVLEANSTGRRLSVERVHRLPATPAAV